MCEIIIELDSNIEHITPRGEHLYVTTENFVWDVWVSDEEYGLISEARTVDYNIFNI